MAAGSSRRTFVVHLVSNNDMIRDTQAGPITVDHENSFPEQAEISALIQRASRLAKAAGATAIVDILQPALEMVGEGRADQEIGPGSSPVAGGAPRNAAPAPTTAELADLVLQALTMADRLGRLHAAINLNEALADITGHGLTPDNWLE